MRAWRDLPITRRTQILHALRRTNYGTIARDHTYSLAFHHCDLLLRRGLGGLYVDGADVDALKVRLAKHKGVSEIIEFENEADCIAFCGDPEHKGTQVEALEYYVDVSDVENAVKIFKKLPKEVRGDMTPEEFEGSSCSKRTLRSTSKNTSRRSNLGCG